jgi:lysophospholipase L1-like esterase
MKTRTFSVLATLFLSACGSGTSATVAQAPPAPAPVVTAPQRTAIVFIGDSITASWQTLEPTGIINAGSSGQWSELMVGRFDADVMAHNPAIVHILAGTNDVRLFVDPTTQYIASMADKAAASGACVIIGTVPPNSVWGANPDIDNVSGGKAILAFNEKLKTFARSYGYLLADYYPVLTLPDGTIDQSLYTDGIHPNLDGHAKMWDVVAPLIAQCKLRLGIP